MRVARPVILNTEQRQALEQQARARSLPARLVERSRIVLLAADGKQDLEIAATLKITPKGGPLARPVSSSRFGGPGEGCAATGPHTQHHGQAGPAGYSEDDPREARERHALEHPQHGRRLGNQPDQRSADLASAWPKAPSGGDVQGQQRSRVCRETGGDRRSVPPSPRARHRAER